MATPQRFGKHLLAMLFSFIHGRAGRDSSRLLLPLLAAWLPFNWQSTTFNFSFPGNPLEIAPERARHLLVCHSLWLAREGRRTVLHGYSFGDDWFG